MKCLSVLNYVWFAMLNYIRRAPPPTTITNFLMKGYNIWFTAKMWYSLTATLHCHKTVLVIEQQRACEESCRWGQVSHGDSRYLARLGKCLTFVCSIFKYPNQDSMKIILHVPNQCYQPNVQCIINTNVLELNKCLT